MHLIWIQLEAYGALNDEKNKILEEALTKIDFDTVNLSQTVCAAPSTVMTSMGMLTGVPPVYLAKDHIPKTKTVPNNFQAVGFKTITDFLEENEYQIKGLSAIFDSPRFLPMFKDTHEGVTPDMCKEEGCNFWKSWCVVQRTKNIIGSFTANKKAIFFHLMEADTLPEILSILEKAGFHKNNTVLALIGDHGWPIRFKEKEPALFHDLHQEENNIRVACQLAYPGSRQTTYSHFNSALDIAPTVLEIMGFDSTKALPKAHGVSLRPYLEKNIESPDRIMRIDNRYIAQRKNKAITLVNSQFRYTYRYDTDWQNQPYYQYRFKPVKDKEELYLREDIEESSNLIYNNEYKDIINDFRDFFEQSETDILKHFYGKDLFKHHLLSEKSPHKYRDTSSRLHSSSRIQKILLSILKTKIDEMNLSKVALYGAGNHTRSILNQRIINSIVSVIFDDNALFKEIEGIPVLHPNDELNQQYDALIISSDYFEPQLAIRAKEWLPKNKSLLTIYEGVGENLLCTLLEGNFTSCNELLNRILSLTVPEQILSLNENFNKRLLENKNTVYTPSDVSDNSLKTILKLYPENKFDLITYKTKNIFELSEWLSRVDELLDTCGIFLAEIDSEIPINRKDFSNIIAQDFKVEVLENKNSTLILGHLWRFNS